jgi:hypothetical protein
MADAAPASLTFLPWVRQGAASLIATPDTLGANQPGVVNLSAALSINTTAMPPITVRLRGPADVVGIDANQIIRREPPPGTADFEPNYFPCIEFDRADFPWLFTPASAAANARLRPWLALVAVRKQEGVTLASTVDAPLPSLQIASPANPAAELPDLGESWAWAHAQAASTDSTAGPVRAALEGAPSLSLSRLICPRILAPNTAYIACVVPSFELGRKAGLGLAIADADLVAFSALAPAWSLTPAPAQLTLPVYHSWEFQTGPDGDFASLAARLRPLPPPATLGQRAIDISHPGFALPADFPAGTTLALGGALRPVLPPGNPDPLTDWPDVTALPFQTALATIVNAPGQLAVSDPNADPLLAPPLYGRWYAARATVTRGAADWFDQLNLDPRLRSVAAFGTGVVQKYQEALMASAWEQAGELQRANQRLRQLQMSLVVGASLQARHFTRLADEAMLRVSAPVLSRIGLSSAPGTQTMLAQVRTTSIPVQALAPAMRRIGRERGPLTRRVAAQGGTRFGRGTWIATLESGTAVLPAPNPLDLATTTAVSQHMTPPGSFRAYTDVTGAVIINWGGMPWFVVRAEGQPLPIEFSFSHGTTADDSPSARAFRNAAVAHLTRVDPGRGASIVPHPHVPPVPLTTIRGTLSQQTQPQQTIGELAQGIVSVVPPVLRPSATATIATRAGPATTSPVDTVMWAPTFPQPMYESLRDLSQELLLPGLDAVGPDSVLGLETNRRFIESFLMGLNVEMGRKLLWRGFPTDQLGTYFDQFWGGGPDIPPLHLWSTRALGDAPTPRENFVMLMRSALLRRYPNAILYLTPAVASGGGRSPSVDPADEKLPVFSGAAEPDINFVGFDVPADQVANGSPDHPQGYYLVIQQHPTEPRFGLPDGIAVGGASHVSIAGGPPAGLPLTGLQWGLNAAHMAGILRRLPVRLAIHASQFFTSTSTVTHA